MRPLLLAVVAMLPVPVVAEMWVARYNGSGDSIDRAYAMTVDRSGNVYVTGESGGSGTGRDYVTIKYSSSGDELWVARYNGPGDGVDSASAVVVDKMGNVYVTGASSGLENFDYATIKYDSLGLEQWVRRYNGPENGADYARALAMDEAGNVYVAGASGGSGHGTIKYDSSGNQEWVTRDDLFGVNAYSEAIGIVVDGSGSVYVTGWSGLYAGGPWGSDYGTVKYSSSGDSLWTARYHRYTLDYPGALIFDSTRGRIYVTGSSAEIYSDYATVAYDLLGQQLWVTIYDSSKDDHASAIALDSAGNVFITGRGAGSWNGDSISGYDYLTIKYDSQGGVLWMREYNGPADGDDRGLAMAVDRRGDVYVTGTSERFGSGYDYATVKYSSAGDSLWVARHDGQHYHDEPSAMVIDDSGYVYVTGRSVGPSLSDDYLTIKYHPSGPGVEEEANRQSATGNGQLSVCPNPFSTCAVLRARQRQGIAGIAVYDIGGRKVSAYVLGQSRITIGAELKCGIYFLRCVSYQGTLRNDVKPVKITKVKISR